MSDERQRWIDAAKALVADSSARVRRPHGGKGDLTVLDVPFETGLERYLTCAACGAGNAILL